MLVMKSLFSWVHLAPVLPLPRGLAKRLSHSSIRPHGSEGKLAGKSDTAPLQVSRLLRIGQDGVKVGPIFPNV